VSNSPEDVAGQQLTGEKLGRARSSGIVAPLPDEVGAAEGAGASHLPVAAVDVDRRRSLSVESAPAEPILAWWTARRFSRRPAAPCSARRR
jgi:hypothetical protein